MAESIYVRWPSTGGGGGGSGTVTSVSLADGSIVPIFTITGSPVTGSGTLTETLRTQSANTVFSGPTSGAAAQPTFRALVSADISTLFGNLTDAGTDGIVITGGAGSVFGAGTSIAQHVADTTHNGYLSSTDWNTFNGKQASGSYITALTGDVTATGPGSVAASLVATTNSTLATLSALTSVGAIATGTWNATTIAIAHGGTGVTSVTTSPAATAFAGWDANKNLSANAVFGSFTSTVTSATPVTLTVASTQYQAFTGSTAQTVLLPTTGVAAGMSWTIYNLSSAVTTLEASAGGTIQAMAASTFLIATANVATPTTAAGWYWQYDTIDSTVLPIALGGTGASSLASGAISSNGTVLSSGTLAIANGGTAKTTVTIAPTLSSWAGWDANKNLSANALIPGFTTTATATGTTTMTIASTQLNIWTGTLGQIVKLPTTSVVAGQEYTITNLSTGSVTVQSSGANTITILTANTTATFTSLIATPTTAANWSSSYDSLSSALVAPTIQRFTSGSGTYTTPTSPRAPLYLKIKLIGGGGAGSDFVSSAGVNGNAGGNTTFSAGTIIAGGGGGGLYNPATTTAAGGTNTVGALTVLENFPGNPGFPGSGVAAGSSGGGASSSVGGGGLGSYATNTASATAGVTNTGGGGGAASTTNANACSGGASGGTLLGIIVNPAATYTYAIGAGGTIGTGATAAQPGGSGLIVVEEFYQ